MQMPVGEGPFWRSPYTTFRMARAIVGGHTLFAEAGSGTGKTFAYLLPAVCYARFRGKPVVVATASGVLQAQLANPHGDIQTLSRLLDLKIDARLSADPAGYICKLKVNHLPFDRPGKGWKALHNWTQRTKVGARSEVPKVTDDLWEHVAWDASLPCDTCRHRGTCHVMAARREYRGAADLVITDHRLFARDLLTRAERQQTGQLPLLFSSATLEPGYMARVLQLNQHAHSQVGVPFNLAEQVLIYQPAPADDELAASLVGATFWEGVDVPGESLSCVVVPRLPFPAHDPLIRERREQAAAAGADPFVAVDLPEMLVRLKQGVGRLIRSSQDRGVLALLDPTHADKPWADRVAAALPQGSIRTASLERLAEF